MPKVLILVGDGVEAQEIFYPYYRLKEEGIDIDVVVPEKKKDFIFTVVHDFEPGWETYTEKFGYRFPWVTKGFGEINPGNYDGLIIPGGRAPEWIRLHPKCREIVKHFFEEKKPIAAICHGPLVLIGTCPEYLKGKKMTAYIAVKPDIEGVGAKYEDKEVVVDGNLITSRAWPDLPAFMREFLKLLRK